MTNPVKINMLDGKVILRITLTLPEEPAEANIGGLF